MMRPDDSITKSPESHNSRSRADALKLRSSANSRTPSPPPVHERGEVVEDLPSGACTPPAVPHGIYRRQVASKVSAAMLPLGIPNHGAQATAPARLVLGTKLPAGFFAPPGLQAPPGLHLPQATSVQEMQPAGWQSSAPTVGSINHPHNCGGACRYAKRKGGCRDGEACTSCHLCFWHRAGEMRAASQVDGLSLVADFASAGTAGHPEACGAPCKYVKRKGGCRDGANCPNCHVCLWRRESPAEVPSEREERSVQPPAVAPTAAVFGDSGENLRDLIVSLLSSQESRNAA